ncbi:MAG: deoxyribodipyrimidine photolyase, partial [Bdellovibrionaceae bacterium]|nr:deoxyribodipyrimidine photolyase [Pseudobdellovibrionaceae bacterium]
MKSQNSICWLRRDLRLRDHRSLYESCHESNFVYIVFIFDTQILKDLKKNDRRISHLVGHIKSLKNELMALNKDIILLKGNPVDLIPELCHKLDCRAVYTNEDYEPYAKKRDLAVFNKLKEHEISFYSYKDQVIFSGQEIVKGNQTPYKVFTP